MKLPVFAITALLSLALINTRAQTVDDIVRKHIEAIGGADNWKKINSMRKELVLSVQGNDVNVTITALNGKGWRQDIAVMGNNGYLIVTPTSGWTFMPWTGETTVHTMTPEEVKSQQYNLDVQGALIDYKEKGSTVALVGKDSINGAACYKLKLTRKNATKPDIYFIDANTWYLVRATGTQIANGQEMETTTNFSNFQKLPEGVVIPMTFTRPIGGNDVDVKVTKVEINKPVDESIFKSN